MGGGLALPVWIDFMTTALRNVPVEEPVPPEGVVNIGGEWFYEEYTSGTGVRELGPEAGEGAHSAPQPQPMQKTHAMNLVSSRCHEDRLTRHREVDTHQQHMAARS